MTKRLGERDLICMMQKGQTDFTGCAFEGPVDICCKDFAYGEEDHIFFAEASINGDFFIGDLTAGSISFEHTKGRGNIGIYRSNIKTICCRLMNHGWFTVTGSVVDSVELTSSVPAGGFMIKGTPLNTLILDKCQSHLSLLV